MKFHLVPRLNKTNSNQVKQNLSLKGKYETYFDAHLSRYVLSSIAEKDYIIV
jgi:hypothetical protein